MYGGVTRSTLPNESIRRHPQLHCVLYYILGAQLSQDVIDLTSNHCNSPTGLDNRLC